MLKQILSVFITFLGLFFLVAPVFAQSEEDLAKKYGITFPIAELGNCTNVASCKTFCDDTKNHQSCTDFAKKHKLSGDSSKSSSEKSDEEILKLARAELGCSSYDACMQFCEEENNMEKCIDFAARHNLMENASQMKQQMSALKNLLGCNSMKACMDFCNNPINMQKCMEVFKQAGFSVEANYSGPGGCDSEQSCQAYCEKNPKECGGDNFQSEPPEVWCNKVSTDCKWDGTTCACGGAYSPQESGDVWCPKSAQAGQICSWNGTSCSCWDPEACQKGGCTWTGSECRCEGTSQTQIPSAIEGSGCIQQGCNWTGTTCDCSALPPVSIDGKSPEVWCSEQGEGCKWTGTTCDCSASQAISCQNSGCTWDGTSCQCPVNPVDGCPEKGTGCFWDGTSCICDSGVKGATTNRSLLQKILDFILRL